MCCMHALRCAVGAQVENGDLNWILPGKLLAFSGPAVRPTDYVGFRAMVPEDYWDYFRRRGIQAIVRLNKKVRHCKLLGGNVTRGGCYHLVRRVD